MIPRDRLEQIVDAKSLNYETAVLDDYAADMSFVNPVRPTCVVRPKQAAEIQQLVKLANETHTPLIPISSGPPHFRGDTVPGSGGAIIVDLSGMKQIMFVDRDRRVAMCEPGVTFSELIPAARKAGLRLNMPLMPRANKSVVASILEREPVTLPKYQWDASDPLACAGVCFGNGAEFRTGQAAGPGTLEEQWAVGGVQKAPYGPGTPSLHRLIQGAQGTMGIVTWLSMRCELLPTLEQPFVVGSGDLDELLELAYWLIRLSAVNECFILNNASLAAMFTNSAADGRKLKATLPAWTLFYTVAGYEYFPEERVASQISDITTITQRLNLEAVHAVGGLTANVILKAAQQPSDDRYWKLRPQGGCQDVFYLTPREKIAGQIGAMNELADRSGHAAADLGVYIQPMVQGASYHCEFNLFYDNADARDRNRVKDLTETATRQLLNLGAFFSRPYGNDTRSILNRDSASVEVLRTFKKIFDPNNVMNPGKVCF